jgi:hypothetical protein
MLWLQGEGIAPRLKRSPSLAFGLGTASQEFSAENSCSGGSIPQRDNKRKGRALERLSIPMR